VAKKTSVPAKKNKATKKKGKNQKTKDKVDLVSQSEETKDETNRSEE
jgi:hypothetical protein